MTKKELYAVRDLRKKIRDTEDYLDLLRCRVTNLTPELDGLPHAQSYEARIERVMLMIMDAERELEACRQQLWFEIATLTDKICQAVEETPMRRVLLMRYVDGLKFNTIASELNFSVERIYQLHRDGVQRLHLHYSIDL